MNGLTCCHLAAILDSQSTAILLRILFHITRNERERWYCSLGNANVAINWSTRGTESFCYRSSCRKQTYGTKILPHQTLSYCKTIAKCAHVRCQLVANIVQLELLEETHTALSRLLYLHVRFLYRENEFCTDDQMTLLRLLDDTSDAPQLCLESKTAFLCKLYQKATSLAIEYIQTFHPLEESQYPTQQALDNIQAVQTCLILLTEYLVRSTANEAPHDLLLENRLIASSLSDDLLYLANCRSSSRIKF